jgi:hypothetical protein
MTAMSTSVNDLPREKAMLVVVWLSLYGICRCCCCCCRQQYREVRGIRSMDWLGNNSNLSSPGDSFGCFSVEYFFCVEYFFRLQTVSFGRTKMTTTNVIRFKQNEGSPQEQDDARRSLWPCRISKKKSRASLSDTLKTYGLWVWGVRYVCWLLTVNCNQKSNRFNRTIH